MLSEKDQFLTNYIDKTSIKCSYKYILLYLLGKMTIKSPKIDESILAEKFNLFYKLREQFNLVVETDQCNPLNGKSLKKVLKTPLDIFEKEKIVEIFEDHGKKKISLGFAITTEIILQLEHKIVSYFEEKCNDTNEETQKILRIWNYHIVNGVWDLHPNHFNFSEKIIKPTLFGFNKAKIEEIVALLDEYKQLIFYGPPGTGKTYLAQALAREITGEKYEVIQFHSSYAYEDFVEGIDAVPSEDKKSVIYEAKPKIFRKLCNYAIVHPDKKVVLIIDEINRGDLGRIFGELIIGLEPSYRGKIHIQTALSEKLGRLLIPENLLIIGTMNSLDRSIAIVDYALRRRFLFYPINPDLNVLQEWLTQNCSSVLEDEKESKLGKSVVYSGTTSLRPLNQSQISGIFERLNTKIFNHPNLGKEFQIGHTYFFVKTFEQLQTRYKYMILPLIEEYLNFNLQALQEFTLTKLLPEKESNSPISSD